MFLCLRNIKKNLALNNEFKERRWVLALSRYTNLNTGEKYMTEQNALRHYISKAYKVRKRQKFEEMYSLWHEAAGCMEIYYCYKCEHDDFGYCGLRHTNISEEDKFKKYCFNGFVKYMENELKFLQNSNKH